MNTETLNNVYIYFIVACFMLAYSRNFHFYVSDPLLFIFEKEITARLHNTLYCYHFVELH